MSGTNNHLLTQQQSRVAVKFLIAILRWYSIHPTGRPSYNCAQPCANARVNDLSEEQVLLVMHRELDSDPLFTNV